MRLELEPTELSSIRNNLFQVIINQGVQQEVKKVVQQVVQQVDRNCKQSVLLIAAKPTL